MSALVSTVPTGDGKVGALEPEPLVLDLPAVSAGARMLVEHRGPVQSYLAVIARVPLGARPIVIGGQVAGSYDPLDKQPELRRGLQAAQRHAEELSGYLYALHSWASGGLDDLIGKITAALSCIHDLLATVPSGGALTESQSRLAVEQMSHASLYSWLIGLSAGQARQGVGEFLAFLGNDHETLTRGPAEVEGNLQKTKNDVLAESLRYMTNPVTAPIGQIIAQSGGQVIAALEQLLGPLREALRGHQEMRTGVSALATAVQSLQGKYAAAEQAVTQGSPADKTALLRKLKIDVAIASWNQFSEFIKKSGL